MEAIPVAGTAPSGVGPPGAAAAAVSERNVSTDAFTLLLAALLGGGEAPVEPTDSQNSTVLPEPKEHKQPKRAESLAGQAAQAVVLPLTPALQPVPPDAESGSPVEGSPAKGIAGSAVQAILGVPPGKVAPAPVAEADAKAASPRTWNPVATQPGATIEGGQPVVAVEQEPGAEAKAKDPSAVEPVTGQAKGLKSRTDTGPSPEIQVLAKAEAGVTPSSEVAQKRADPPAAEAAAVQVRLEESARWTVSAAEAKAPADVRKLEPAPGKGKPSSAPVTFVPYERPAVHQPLPEPSDSLQGSLRLQVHVTPSQLVEHIVANARLASDGSSQAQLQLQPESLGRLHINMTVHDGRINLVMTAETPQAQQAIMDGLADLATALSAAGMTLAQANVTLSDNGHNRHFAQPGSNAWHGDSEEDVGPVETAMWPRSLSILDLSA